jgi:hypothetical protein
VFAVTGRSLLRLQRGIVETTAANRPHDLYEDDFYGWTQAAPADPDPHQSHALQRRTSTRANQTIN